MPSVCVCGRSKSQWACVVTVPADTYKVAVQLRKGNDSRIRAETVAESWQRIFRLSFQASESCNDSGMCCEGGVLPYRLLSRVCDAET